MHHPLALSRRTALALAAALSATLLAGCSTLPRIHAALGSDLSAPSGPAATAHDTVLLQGATPRAGWQLTLSDFEARVPYTGQTLSVPKPPQARVPASQVSARPATRQSAGDAVTLQFHDAWFANLRLDGGTPLDLRAALADGTLALDLNVVELAQGGITFAFSCGQDCTRKVNWLLPARAAAGKGWQPLAFPLRCFVRDGDLLGAVPQPFSLEASGTGEVAIANVRITQSGAARANGSCPDYKTESVTPAPLVQPWSLTWWVPRHEKKLAEARALRAAGKQPQVIFVGDSITEGWEKDGKAVWDRHYAPLDALDLGFGGDHTENVLWRIEHGELDGIAPRVAVLMIGTNNTGDRQEDPRTTAAGVHRILDEMRRRLPSTQIVLLAVFPRDEQPGSPLRKLNDRLNLLLADEARGERTTFLNINSALMNPDGTLSRELMPDLLHLSERGYTIWAERLAPTLKALLQPVPATAAAPRP